MKDISNMGIPLVMAVSVVTGGCLYVSQLEARLTTIEVNASHLEQRQEDTKLFFEDMRKDARETSKSNAAIFDKLNENLAIMNQRLVVLETVLSKRKND